MSQSHQFLDDFQEKMNRLAVIRRDLQDSVQFKQQFTDDLKTKLGEINGKVKQIAGLINDLKTKADDLENQVGTNATSISDRERQIGEINQQIANTSAEKDRITQEFNDHKGRTQTQINEQQAKIDQLEEQLRLANEQKESAENNLKALQADTQARGDEKDNAHAQALAQLAEKNRQQLEQQQQQLIQRIDEADKQVIELQEQLRQKTAEYEQLQQQLGENQNQVQGRVAELQSQIDVLTQENQQLIQRLMSATQAINEANDELEAIVNSVPNAQTKQEVDALLNEITQQLEQSIQNISRAAQGQLPQGAQGGQVDSNTNFEISGYNMNYGQIISQLDKKAKQLERSNPTAENKYKTAIGQIRSNPANIPTILTNNGITIKAGPDGSGVISGGRKTRKNKKQKGGFTYKVGVRRRSIRSKSSRRTSRNSLRKSSR